MANLGFTFDPSVTRALSNYELAVSLHEHGLHVFPCQHEGEGAKQPCPGVMWRRKATRQIIDQQWQRWPDAMPGLNLGESDLLVVDADGAAGIAAWEAIAAEHGGCDAPTVDTPGDGRHYYFRQPEGMKHGNARGALPKKDVCPIDIRGAGGYVIAPGAEREDGTYEPSDGDPLAILDAPIMPPWLVELLTKEIGHEPQKTAENTRPVTGLEISADHPRLRAYIEQTFNDEIRGLATCGTGGRNNQLNTAGFSLFQLAAAKWSGISASEVESALFQAAEDCGLVRDDGATSVRKTIRSARKGGMASPRPLPEHIASEIDEECRALEIGSRSARNLTQLGNGSIIDESTGEVIHEPLSQQEDGELPPDFTNVPGLVGEITDWIEGTARKPSRVLALGAALTVTGTLMGRRLSGPTRSGTHLYLLTLAKSGAGKDHALVQSDRLLAACGMSTAIGPDEFMSQTAIINRLAQTPLMHCAMDEFGAWMAHINSPKAGPHAAGISKILRTAWGRSFAPMKTPEWAGKSSEVIQAPAMSILGASTPDEFFAALKGKDVINGFLNRFIVLSSLKRPSDVSPQMDAKQVPEKIQKRMSAIFGGGSSLSGITGQFYSDPKTEIVPIPVPWANTQAEEIFRDLQTHLENFQDRNPSSATFYARTAEISVRLATIRAVGVNTLKPVISVSDIEWARDLAMWSANRMADDAGLYMAETDSQENANKVMRIIQENGGSVRRSIMLRALQHSMKSRDLDDTIKLLKEAEQITEGTMTTKGRAAKYYILNKS